MMLDEAARAGSDSWLEHNIGPVLALSDLWRVFLTGHIKPRTRLTSLG
jgi:hypothetical protein